MGSGRWSTDVYEEMERARTAHGGSAFAHYDRAKKTGDYKVHDTLDPRGVKVRESRDSDEHPNTNAIAVILDVTGSMRTIPMTVQQKLPQLLGLLLYKNYIPHPQILFGAVGDAVSDHAPLQMGQFESDNRMDAHLQNLILEGNGGPYGMESYELALYFMARHTSIDCYEKRGKKGYLFLIGDEMAYHEVKSSEVRDWIDKDMRQNVKLAQIISEAAAKYHVYMLIPTGAAGGNNPQIVEFWKTRIGEQQVIALENADDVSETIALIIGTREGTIGLDDGIADLRAAGATDSTIASVGKALAAVGAGASSGRASITGSLTDSDGESKSKRL